MRAVARRPTLGIYTVHSGTRDKAGMTGTKGFGELDCVQLGRRSCGVGGCVRVHGYL